MERLLTMDKEQFIRLPHPPPARHQIPKIPPFPRQQNPNSSVVVHVDTVSSNFAVRRFTPASPQALPPAPSPSATPFLQNEPISPFENRHSKIENPPTPCQSNVPPKPLGGPPGGFRGSAGGFPGVRRGVSGGPPGVLP